MKLLKLFKYVCFATVSTFVLATAAYALNGTGTQDDPYTISTAQDLMEFSELASENSFKNQVIVLENDIELLNKSDFTYTDAGIISGVEDNVEGLRPIGTKETPFEGTFDGKGYTISGLYVDGTNEYSGLFGYVKDATISNVTIFDSLCFGKKYSGMLCAYADGETTINNANISGSVIGKGEGLCAYMGGVLGFNGKEATLSDTVSYAYVSGSRAYSVYTGGVVGVNMGTVTHVGFGGKAHSEAAYLMSFCGGIAGGNRGYIEYAISEGNVSGETSALVTESYVGGVVGQNANGGRLAVCVNYGEVSNSCYNVSDNICAAGGVVGINANANIHQSANYGNINADSVYAGGIVGIIMADEADCLVASAHNRANITSENGVSGGIAGLSSSSNEYKVTLDACLNTGSVLGNVAGGILAHTTENSSNSFVNCYYGINSPSDTNATSVTESTLKSGTALTGFTTQLWSFTSTQLPFLANENGLTKPSYLVCPQRDVVLYTGNDIVPDSVTLTKGTVKFSEQLKAEGIYRNVLVTGDMTSTAGYFSPAPCRMDVAIVTDLEKSQILSVEYDEQDLMKINISAYLPSNHNKADFVAAVYVDGALTGLTLETMTITDSFYTCSLKLPESYNAKVQAIKQVKVFIFDDITNMKPICQSKEA